MIAHNKTQYQVSTKTPAASAAKPVAKTAVAARPALGWGWLRLAGLGAPKTRCWANQQEARRFQTQTQVRSAHDHLLARKIV